MKISNDAEEIVERMWICTEEKRIESVPLDTLGMEKESPEILELIEKDNITLEGNNVILNPKGIENGRNVVRRHRLAERLLVDVLDTKDRYVHTVACEFEHVLHRGIDDKICTLLGHPRTCPHGRNIPEGECCIKAQDRIEKVVAPLSSLNNGQRGKVAYFDIKNEERLQKIMSMGVLPSMPIGLVQSYPSYVFDMEHTRYAVDREMADCIYVKIESGA